MWVWSSRLAEDAWGWGSTDQAAKNGLEAWLRGWLEELPSAPQLISDLKKIGK
jgi:hypothetical protein